MVYTLTVAPCIDYRLDLAGQPIRIGGVNRPVSKENRLGGKGITVSNMLNNLGVENQPIVAVGGNVGNEIKEIIDKEYSNPIYLETEEESRINVIILADTDTRFDPKAPKVKNSEIKRMYEILKERLTKEDILVLSGSLGQEVPSFYADLMREVTSKVGCKVIVDTVNEALLATFPFHPFFIKPNNEELGDILGRKIESDEDIIKGGSELLSRGPENVIVSMGSHGSYFFAHDGSIYHISVAKGYPFINPVGTGDSSIAGFIKGYVEHKSLEDTLKLMAAAGGATAFSNGLGSLKLTEELVKQIVVTKVR